MFPGEQVLVLAKRFYLEGALPFKNLEKQVIKESQGIKLFKKLDYSARIEEFRAIEALLREIDSADLDLTEDEDGQILKEKLFVCTTLLISLCQGYIAMEEILMKKNNREKYTLSEYKEALNRIREENLLMMRAYQELNDIYMKYAE